MVGVGEAGVAVAPLDFYEGRVMLGVLGLVESLQVYM